MKIVFFFLWTTPLIRAVLVAHPAPGWSFKGVVGCHGGVAGFSGWGCGFCGCEWSQVPLKRGPGHQVLFFLLGIFSNLCAFRNFQNGFLIASFGFGALYLFFWNQGWWKICLNSNKTTLYVIMLFSFQDRVFDTNPVISIDPERWKCRIRRIRRMPDIVASTFALSQRSFPRKFPWRNLVIEASLEILNSSVIWGPVPLGLHPISAGDRSLPHHGNEGAASFFGGRTVSGWWSNLHILKHCNGINGTL